jgi:hypothetical protein
MFSADAADAVAHDPQRYTLDFPPDAAHSPPPREQDAMANLFKGQAQAGEYSHDRRYRDPPRRRRR